MGLFGIAPDGFLCVAVGAKPGGSRVQSAAFKQARVAGNMQTTLTPDHATDTQVQT